MRNKYDKETIKEKILFFMESSRKRSFSMEEIAEGLGFQKSDDFKLLVQTIAQMEREQSIVFNKRKSETSFKTNLDRRNISSK